MNNNPLVSVILPTFNRSDFLLSSVGSLLTQSYTNIEIIVIDDGSTDNTQKIVNNFSDKRINYIKLDKNEGANYARNIGIKNASGQFITFIDSDNIFKKDKIEEEIKIIKDSDSIGLVYSWFSRYYIGDNNKNFQVLDKPEYRGHLFNKLLYHNIIGNPSPMVRKKCFDKVGNFDENLKSCQDWEMWLRISQHFQIEYLNKPLVKVAIHGKQISTNIKYKIQGMEYIHEKYKPYLNDNRELSVFLRRIGNFHSIDNNKKKSIKYYIESIKTNPANLYSFIHLLTILLSKTLHQKLLKRFSFIKIGESYLYY